MRTPHMPQAPCMGAASSGSSMRNLRMAETAPKKISAPNAPAMMAAQGSRTAQPAVMETRPQSSPLQTSRRFHMPVRLNWKISAETPPAPAERVVVTATRPTTSALMALSISSMEPGLKPYQPNQRQNVPSTTSVAEWPGMSCTTPSLSKRPMRGPTRAAPMRPAKPPVMCTTPLPAKSNRPVPSRGLELNGDSHPVSAHAQ
mmetsp:Transcript_45008/g.115104  ORF Transcript_45008/g.115104 Transcript_45008/m.115104 type:complete len:202 (+) Transcript_45008:424-1029(+)